MITLRPYQDEASASVFRAWETRDAALIVMATGVGKTVMFSDIIRRMIAATGKKALVLAHRQELIWQAKKTIKAFGLKVSVEMGEHKASADWFHRPDVIVSTVQTQAVGCGGNGRMSKFRPEDFALVVIDEAHHYGHTGIYEKTLKWYRTNPALKILGVTATPDRLDKQNIVSKLGGIAFSFDTLDAIKDGWLVPVKQRMIVAASIDLSHVRTQAGDLNPGELSEIMESERPLHQVAGPLVEETFGLRTIVFAVSVKQAERLAEIINRSRPGKAIAVSAKTPKENRREILKLFKRGAYQYVVNVGILTEGFDDSGVGCVAVARPTKSRALYQQMAGRCIRPSESIAHTLGDIPDASARKELIAASDKPECLIIDYCGNAGKHKLICTADLLAGDAPPKAVERARKRAEKTGEAVDMTEEIARAKRELEMEEARKRLRVVAKTTYRKLDIDPFEALGVTRPPASFARYDEGPTEKMVNLLAKNGIDASGMTMREAKVIMRELFRRWDAKLASVKQSTWLKTKMGLSVPLRKDEASRIMDRVIGARKAVAR